MKKMLSVVFSAIIITLCLAGCKNEMVPNEVELYLKEGSLSPSGAALVIKNNSDFYFTYGEAYCIEKYENDNWVQLPDPKDYAVITIAYQLPPNSESEEINLDWEWRYGKLSQGEYRIVKSFDKTETFEYNKDSTISSQTLYYYFSIE